MCTSERKGSQIVSNLVDLKEYSGRLKWDLNLFRRGILPVNDLLNILTFNLKLITVSNSRLQKDPD